MRMSIHIDGEEARVVGGAGVGARLDQAPAGEVSTDAGAGPDGGATSGTAAAGDTGGPPDWLLEVVGRAEGEAAGGDGAQTVDAGLDAGAGPQG